MTEDDPQFLPFKRHDGHFGLPSSGREALALLLLPLKVCGLVGSVLGYYMTAKFLEMLPAHSRAVLLAGSGRLFSRAALLSLGFLHIDWPPQDSAGDGAAPACYASNHAYCFPSFVAKASVARAPIVGYLSQCMGCVFVEREERQAGTQGVANRVRQRVMDTGQGVGGLPPMLLFPEGTTTNGRFLLPFKTGAFLAGLPVQPLVLQYAEGRVSPAWESIRFPRHLALLLRCLTHTVKVHKLPVYRPNEEERRDPRLFAANVRAAMLRACPFLQGSTATLADKRRYHQQLRAVQGGKQE